LEATSCKRPKTQEDDLRRSKHNIKLTAYIKWRPPEQRPGPDALPGDPSPCQAPTPRPPPSRITPTVSSSASPASLRSAAVGRRRGGGGGGGGSRSQCDEDQVPSAQATVLQPAPGRLAAALSPGYFRHHDQHAMN